MLRFGLRFRNMWLVVVAAATVRVTVSCPLSNLTGCRGALIKSALGSFPTATAPDFMFSPSQMRPGATGGQTLGIGPNVTTLIWTVSDSKTGLALNATVYYSLNTSGTALADYPYNIEIPPTQSAGQKGGNGDTGEPILPSRRSNTLVLYHNGHEAHWLESASKPLCVRPAVTGDDTATASANCWINYDTTLGWLNELGFDAMELNMPLRGPNNNGSLGTMSHKWFEQYEAAGAKTMRFFLNAVHLAINYAETLGYTRVAMIGLSGGGWTTTVAAALDARIGLSIPVAGSIPFAMRTRHAGDPYHDLGDYEQLVARPMYAVCDYKCMYALAALERGRNQVQLLHEGDPCCFGAGARPSQGITSTRHAEILAYNDEVASSAAAGRMCTSVTTGNVHEVNLRDKTIIALLLDAFDRGTLDDEHGNLCDALPFNVLRQWS